MITPKENSKAIYRHLRKEAELPENIIVAMMANIGVETGYTYDYKTKQKGSRKDPAYGLFQFDPRGKGLYSLYMDYLAHRGAEDSMECQLDMMTDILTRSWKTGVQFVGSGNVAKVMLAAEMSAEDATSSFCSLLLRPGKPHMDRRLACIPMVKSVIEEVTQEDS